MSLGAHLVELRNRLFKSAIAIVLGCIAGWFSSEWVFNALKAPIAIVAAQQGKEAVLNFPTIAGAFDLRLQIAITVGIVIASPVWLYQVWAFLVPGLTRKEIRYGLGFILTAIPLFFAGCASGWFVFPHIVELLTSFTGGDAASFLDAKQYYEFVLKLVLVIGVAFVLPVFLVLLNFVGILPGMLILKSWRVAVMIIVLFTAIATPAADPISMLLLAIPIVVLFFAASGIAILHDKRVAKRQLVFDGSPSDLSA
ncbi:twin-arginine translocase subunit TatC [Rathayibacter toxicus]|uniref:Sec-independent protein translocase protein TatC n=1 Tax=Rathayibacter toxicus TaxID=145458 RepID=A0A0C5BHF3_9MICO|nr:twin-arginine translocase subunit TatC [Rathayibacter toxicus]AJM77675.1 preprotein translocase subunit TatC [Rathayibacter toxicus]ALS56385.1 preprotein translocase subunit TatC [Rathayibacter toxicus]KKM45376.1 preprotein translocase subunit TatC [Rathayibacter toxicus]PPG21797.1 twin-arginine translocase subunit TatC [Rathayibacter toxicus]PPG46759.1 twin-arginine translocase subunit TatC [Rathayibacter toxicus]